MEGKRNLEQEPIVDPVDLEQMSPAFRKFYHSFFVDKIIVLRNELDDEWMNGLSPDELDLARRLVRANLANGQIYREAAGLLNDHDAIPLLHTMLEETRGLSEKIYIALPLWYLEQASVYPVLINKLVHSKQSELKKRHIWEILSLGDMRAIDHLFTMAEDADESVRELAIFHLTALSNTWRGRFWNNESLKTPDLAYFKARRTNRRFLARMLRELERS
jgi:hypothetical protein